MHRIQRIPSNDRRGRRHTSTATVIILEDKPFTQPLVLDGDCRIKTKRGSGPGGQHRNKTDSAVQLTHIPTGIMVQIDSERSQLQNLEQAKQVLAKRLHAQANREQAASVNSERQQQASSPERSFKHFTWNTQRNEVVSHDGLLHFDMQKLLKGKMDSK